MHLLDGKSVIRRSERKTHYQDCNTFEDHFEAENKEKLKRVFCTIETIFLFWRLFGSSIHHKIKITVPVLKKRRRRDQKLGTEITYWNSEQVKKRKKIPTGVKGEPTSPNICECDGLCPY